MDAYSDLIGALIGLVRSIDDASSVPDTSLGLIREGLLCSDGKEAEDLIERIHWEKDRLLPMCASCSAPCGRHDDFDMASLEDEKEETRMLKLKLLCLLRKIAEGPLGDGLFMARSLFSIGEEGEMDDIIALLNEAEGYLKA